MADGGEFTLNVKDFADILHQWPPKDIVGTTRRPTPNEPRYLRYLTYNANMVETPDGWHKLCRRGTWIFHAHKGSLPKVIDDEFIQCDSFSEMQDLFLKRYTTEAAQREWAENKVQLAVNHWNNEEDKMKEKKRLKDFPSYWLAFVRGTVVDTFDTRNKPCSVWMHPDPPRSITHPNSLGKKKKNNKRDSADSDRSSVREECDSDAPEDFGFSLSPVKNKRDSVWSNTCEEGNTPEDFGFSLSPLKASM